MTILPAALALAAGAVLLVLALLHAAKGGRRPQKTLFITTASILAAAQVCLGFLLLQTRVEAGLVWLQALSSLTLFFPAVATPFFLVFGKADDGEILRRRLPWLFFGFVAAAAAAATIPVRVLVAELHFVDGSGLFWGVTLTDWGKVVGVFVLASNVLYLFFLENTYRAASIPEKVTLKYPMLGTVTASVLTVAVVSRALALSDLDRNFLAIQSAGMIALGASLLFATMRYRLFDVRVYVGRQVASSLVSVGIAGAYLVALALVSYLSGLLGVSYDRLTLQVLGVFAVFLIVAALLSGRVRRRIRHFVNQNFYLNRLDYRTEWRRFAQLSAAGDRIDIYLANFISQLCESLMAQRGLIWVNVGGGISGSYGIDEKDQTACIDALRAIDIEPGEARLLNGSVAFAGGGAVRAAAALGTSSECLGFVALGSKSMDLSYGEEDRDFVAVLADQVTIAVENYQLGQAVIDSHQTDTFNRLASFVVHDLKNTVGMLSMTADNARERIDDAEFQKDAIDTIQRSVAKMKSLIESLRALESDPALQRERIDVSELVTRTTTSLKSVAAARGMSLDLAESSPVIADVDVSTIERVVENLVLNALDASPQGGVVTVAVVADGEVCRVEVSDRGPGFDEDYLRTRLYRPFQSTKKEGLGVGLLMCKTIAAAHGGDIHIDSPRGGPTIVSVLLPLTQDKT